MPTNVKSLCSTLETNIECQLYFNLKKKRHSEHKRSLNTGIQHKVICFMKQKILDLLHQTCEIGLFKLLKLNLKDSFVKGYFFHPKCSAVRKPVQ